MTVAEKFHAALRTLTGPGSQRQRLERAYTSSLADVKPEDLPTIMREKFIDFRSSLTYGAGLPAEDSVPATTAQMADAQVTTAVERFFDMCDQLFNFSHRHP